MTYHWYYTEVDFCDFNEEIGEEVFTRYQTRSEDVQWYAKDKFEKIVNKFIKSGDYTLLDRTETEVRLSSPRLSCLADDYEDYPDTITTITFKEEIKES